MVDSDIINVDASRSLNNVVQNLSKGIVQIFPLSSSILECGIHNHLLYFGSLLVIDQSQVKGVLAHLCQDIIRMSKSISYSYPLEAC